MIEIDKIYNEDNLVTMEKMDSSFVDMIMTSPPYNTNLKAKGGATLERGGNYLNYGIVRYDSFVDVMSNDDYIDFTRKRFLLFDKILKKDGVICYNISYGSENADCMFRTINDIIVNTVFTIADVIVWKKKSALPNSVSPNKLTRITEFVFVFVRKEDYQTFFCNKQVTSLRKSGQKAYENIFNFIEAPNNNGTCDLNKATYSKELCYKLIRLYCRDGGTVYDPFMGTGTTAVACKENGFHYIGSEISSKQCEYAENRIKPIKQQLQIF